MKVAPHLRHAAALGIGWLCVVAGSAACSSTEDPPAVRAPRLVEAAEMVGAVHLTWVNEEPACDAVEIERRSATPSGEMLSDFTLVYTLPGAADNKHDGEATGGSTYTYRLRCKKGARHSTYSNELSVRPQ